MEMVSLEMFRRQNWQFLVMIGGGSEGEGGVGLVVGFRFGRWQCYLWIRVLEGQQVWGEDGEFSFGWVVFNVFVGYFRVIVECVVGDMSVEFGVLNWVESRGQYRNRNGICGSEYDRGEWIREFGVNFSQEIYYVRVGSIRGVVREIKGKQGKGNIIQVEVRGLRFLCVKERRIFVFG